MKGKSIILTSLLCASILTMNGCGNTSEKIEIRVGFWPQNTDRSDIAMYMEWEEKFEADYPQYDIIGDPYIYSPETVQAKAKARTLPTVFQTWFTEPATLKEKGYIRECTSQLNELGWLNKMDQEMKETLTFDDKVYGVPRDGYGLGLLLNKRILGDVGLLPEIDGKYSIFDEEGKPCYPQTFQDIMEWSYTVTEYESAKGCLILSANKNGGWQFTNIAWNFGATIQYQDKEGKWKADLTSEACVSALTWIQEMKQNELLLDSNTVYYDDWYSKIGSQVAMAFVGNDVLQLAKTKGEVDMNDLAFVPMPTGDGIHHYSLYGGTPYVFPHYVTDEQVEGALKFLEYCGRSPETSTISRKAIIDGNDVAISKAQPILTTIKPWINEDYLTMASKIEEEYVNINKVDYNDFFNNIQANKHAEEPYYAQELYEELDSCIQKVFTNPDNANPRTILETAEANFNKNYMSKVN